ncbi:helix-turn-helix transcriptional regulator [Hyphomonas neptunium]
MGLRFLSLRDVLDRLTISRSLLYELIKDPVQPFPAPIHIGRRSVWVENEVESYMRAVLSTARR